MRLYKKLVLLIPFALLWHSNGSAQKKTNAEEFNIVNGKWLQYSDASNSLYRYLSGQAYELLADRSHKLASLNSLAEWEKRQQFVSETLLDIVGPFPAKTPLNAKVLRSVEKDEYKVEHVIYESQPGFYVTASLFIPKGLKGRAPAIIYCSGHAADGYRGQVYQHVILNLVKKGFIVLAFDPVGQGERLEYFDPKINKSSIGGPTAEHSYPGAQAFVAGSSQARYMIWDGIRTIDYLISRNEIDPERIGITGRSGGGTQSAYIAAFDKRIKAAAPENYITNFTRLLQNIGPQDAEQNLFHGIKRGIDHGDLLTVRAPKPTLMITTTRDIFSIQGARETAAEVAKVYQLYNSESDFSMVEDDAAHASTLRNREAMYAFFQRSLGHPGSSKDEETKPLSVDEIRVTETGQVSTSFLGETVFSLNRKESEKLLKKSEDAQKKNSANYFSTALAAAKNYSGYEEPLAIDQPVFVGRFQEEGFVVEKYFLKGEGDYPIPYLLIKPEQANNKAILYLSPLGKSVEMAEDNQIEWLVKDGYTVLAPDLIGMGEMGPGDFRGDAYIGNTSFNVWFSSLLIGRSITGIQAGDLVKLTRLLHQDKNISEIYGIAKKQAAPTLLHAAAFEPLIARVALIQPYSSYQSIVMSRLYNPSFIPSVVPAALRAYDLPDLAAGLYPRKLMMIGTTDALGQTDNQEVITGDLGFISKTYENNNAIENLFIVPVQSGDQLKLSIAKWLK